MTKSNTLIEFSIKTIVTLFLILLAVILISSIYLIFTFPVTTADVKHSSWLASPSTAMHFNGSAIGYGLAFTIAIVGLVMLFTKDSKIPAITSLLVSLSIIVSGSNAVVYSAGIDHGVIKIGCYVWESDVCQAMIGKEHDANTITKYKVEPTSWDIHTKEYSFKFKASIKNHEQLEDLKGLFSMPGAFFVYAPISVMHLTDITQNLEQQREELRQRVNQ